DNGRDNKVDLRECGHGNGSRSSMQYVDTSHAFRAQPRCKLVSKLLGCHGDQPRLPLFALRNGYIEIASGSKRDGLKTIRKAFADRKGAGADGSGRTEDSDLLYGHCSSILAFSCRGGTNRVPHIREAYVG